MSNNYSDPFTDRAGASSARGPYNVGSVGTASGPLPYASQTTLGQPDHDFLNTDPHANDYRGEEEDELRPLNEGGGFTGGFYPPCVHSRYASFSVSDLLLPVSIPCFARTCRLISYLYVSRRQTPVTVYHTFDLAARFAVL